MAKYMIHAMPKRMWYVEKYLIPSMLEQGIKKEDIRVYNDEKREGNLRACMNAFMQVDDSAEGTWHLQDDVIISHDFKEITEKYDKGIVCGFKSVYDGDQPAGKVSIKEMWFSFLCIRIPNEYAKECAEWTFMYMIGNPVYREYWEKGVNDDWMFRQYISQYHKNDEVINLNPNIVDHVDFLIGGTVNSVREFTIQIRSKLWKDEYLVRELESKLNEIHHSGSK
jgi:hypothetical protein